MENIKKFVAVLLTVALSGVLAACGNSSEESSSLPAGNSSAQNEDGGQTDRDVSDSEGNEAENTSGSSDNTKLNEQEDTDNSSAASNDGESVESSNDQNENHESNKDEYLKKLNKMEEADRYAEAKTTTAELVEQEAERYRTWDEELNKIYNLLEEQLDKGQMDQLRDEQLNWIQQRDETAKKSSLKYKGGSMEPLEYVATQASLTRKRCYLLVARYMK
ncbi:lysozyme inhibitor LprI family protein [Cytobacillus firmus]|uniref:lysozyme inhibitor LprI family protein n=1 Tax=Cytobacillus firmus TaxID=1399 RepID=UPI002228425F|nr:lysozyme inhibitor LprI family protein [Cytobacillus firmus]